MVDSTVKITCSISTTDPLVPLEFEVRLDGKVVLAATQVTAPIKFEHDMSDNDGEHQLDFVLKNKTENDTIIDENGNIIKDARLIVSDVAFDDIELKQIFVNQTVYTHNFNGTGETIEDEFYGEMGCNGTVSLKFSTPMYIWLLENM
jgi:hypothetical protein